jgi:hypothetical protein
MAVVGGKAIRKQEATVGKNSPREKAHTTFRLSFGG